MVVSREVLGTNALVVEEGRKSCYHVDALKKVDGVGEPSVNSRVFLCFLGIFFSFHGSVCESLFL
jgi:hypothetical protein